MIQYLTFAATFTPKLHVDNPLRKSIIQYLIL